MFWTRYVNSSPTLSLLPSTCSPHHPRTSLMASKTSVGVSETAKEVVKLFMVLFSRDFGMTAWLQGPCLCGRRCLYEGRILVLERLRHTPAPALSQDL